MTIKVLMLNYEFPPLGGGAGNATYYLLKEFAGNSHFHFDLITSSSGSYKEETFASNIRIFYLDIGKRGNLHYQSLLDLLRYVWAFLKFRRANLIDGHYDIVWAFLGIPCGYLAYKLGMPYIVSLRGSDVPFYNRRFYWLDRILFRHLSRKIWLRAKGVVANSDDLRDLALRSAPRQNIDVIANGIDTLEFTPSLDARGFVVLSTSRLIERKGIEFVLRGFIEFRKKHHVGKLVLVGGGALENHFKSIVREAAMDDFVDFVGVVNHCDMQAYYKKSHVFVLASENEGMSNSLLEAMASGLAIVATNTGGVGELLSVDSALLVEKSSAKAILIALEKLYLNPQLLLDMRKNSRLKSLQRSWGSSALKYANLLDKYANQ